MLIMTDLSYPVFLAKIFLAKPFSHLPAVNYSNATENASAEALVSPYS